MAIDPLQIALEGLWPGVTAEGLALEGEFTSRVVIVAETQAAQTDAVVAGVRVSAVVSESQAVQSESVSCVVSPILILGGGGRRIQSRRSDEVKYPILSICRSASESPPQIDNVSATVKDATRPKRETYIPLPRYASCTSESPAQSSIAYATIEAHSMLTSESPSMSGSATALVYRKDWRQKAHRSDWRLADRNAWRILSR